MNHLVEIIQQIPGLIGASATALEHLAAQFKRRAYKDEFICREGDAADTLWVLASGDLDVVKASDSGREFVVASLAPVCLFGHVGLFTSSGRTASVRARGAVEVLQMSSTQAHLVLRTSPFEVSSPFRRALIIALSQQLTAANQTLWRLADEANATEPVQRPPDAEARLLRASSSV